MRRQRRALQRELHQQGGPHSAPSPARPGDPGRDNVRPLLPEHRQGLPADQLHLAVARGAAKQHSSHTPPGRTRLRPGHPEHGPERSRRPARRAQLRADIRHIVLSGSHPRGRGLRAEDGLHNGQSIPPIRAARTVCISHGPGRRGSGRLRHPGHNGHARHEGPTCATRHDPDHPAPQLPGQDTSAHTPDRDVLQRT